MLWKICSTYLTGNVLSPFLLSISLWGTGYSEIQFPVKTPINACHVQPCIQSVITNHINDGTYNFVFLQKN